MDQRVLASIFTQYDKLWKGRHAPVPLPSIMGIILSVAGYMKLVRIAGTINSTRICLVHFITLLESCGGIPLILGLFVRYFGDSLHDRIYRET